MREACSRLLDWYYCVHRARTAAISLVISAGSARASTFWQRNSASAGSSSPMSSTIFLLIHGFMRFSISVCKQHDSRITYKRESTARQRNKHKHKHKPDYCICTMYAYKYMYNNRARTRTHRVHERPVDRVGEELLAIGRDAVDEALDLLLLLLRVQLLPRARAGLRRLSSCSSGRRTRAGGRWRRGRRPGTRTERDADGRASAVGGAVFAVRLVARTETGVLCSRRRRRGRLDGARRPALGRRAPLRDGQLDGHLGAPSGLRRAGRRGRCCGGCGGSRRFARPVSNARAVLLGLCDRGWLRRLRDGGGGGSGSDGGTQGDGARRAGAGDHQRGRHIGRRDALLRRGCRRLQSALQVRVALFVHLHVARQVARAAISTPKA